MTIKLDWDGGSTDIDGYYVYRSETPMDNLNPPAPIATLPSTTKTWIDTNTPRGKLYYYRVSAYKGGDVAITFERAMAYVPYTGPGEPNLVMGDWEAGYFGEIPIDDLIPVKVLLATVAPGIVTPVVYATRWFKMAYMGKVIYMPDGHIGTAVWRSLYEGGLVYGDLDPALIPPYVTVNAGDFPQNKRFLIGEDEFIFRLPRSRKDPLSTIANSKDKGGNEWDVIYSKLFVTRSLTEFNQNKGFRSFMPAQSPTVGVWTSDLVLANSSIISRTMTGSASAYVDAYGASTWSVVSNLLPVLEFVL